MDSSRTASNRSLQWGEKIVEPVFESKNDYDVMYILATKFGFADQMFKNIKVENGAVLAEDILREINRGGWSTGYCGQSPERLKAHMRNQHKFDLVTLRAPKDDPEVGGDFYGLPWPCWGTPEFRHPGTAVLYNTNLHVKDGGGTFRARFGVERRWSSARPRSIRRRSRSSRPTPGPCVNANKPPPSSKSADQEVEVHESLLADGSYSLGSEIKDGYPEFTYGVLKKLGWDKDLTAQELATIRRVNPKTPEAVSWSTDLSGGIQRSGDRAWLQPLRQWQSTRERLESARTPSLVHREPIFTPAASTSWASIRRGPTPGSSQCPTSRFSTVQKAAVDKHAPSMTSPLILTSGRLVEYVAEADGEETRSNKWLAELKQEMYVEINPADAKARAASRTTPGCGSPAQQNASKNARSRR